MNPFAMFGHDFALRLTQALLHFVWQGAAIAGAVLAANWCLREAAANWRYWVNVAALGLMAACLPVTLALVPVSPGRPGLEPAAAPAGIVAERPLAGSVLTGAPPGDMSPDRPAAEVRFSRDRADVAADGRSSGAGWAPRVMRGSLSTLQPVAPFATGVYLLGVVVMSLRLAAALWGGRRLRLAATPVTDADLLGMIARQACRLGLRAAPVIARCARISVPVVVGIVKPLVLLPASLATGLTPSHLESLLAHELAHIRRYDLLVNLLQRLIEVVLFFHPAVWYVSRRVSSEREEACDDLVLSAGWPRVQYADALVRMAELCSQGFPVAAHGPDSPATLVAAAGQNRSQLQRRILRLLQPDSSPGLRLNSGGMLLAAILVAGVLLSPAILQSWAGSQAPDALASLHAQPSENPPVRSAEIEVQEQPPVLAPRAGVAPAKAGSEDQPAADRAARETPVPAALERAAKFIESRRRSDGAWQPEPYQHGLTALCTLALLHAGRRPDEPAVKEPLERLGQVPPSYTYTVALHTAALCAADPAKHRDAIKKNVAWLAETQTTEGESRGGWSYGPQRSTRADGSCTRFAVWALGEAARVGMAAPDATWRNAADYWLRSQKGDGAWGYMPGPSEGTVTMTLAGIASLAAARRTISDAALQRNIDAAVARAWKWHDGRYSGDRLAQHPAWPFYALQALGMAASLTGHSRIGDTAWRDKAIPLLLSLQDARDGSWRGNTAESPLIAASMAILFLTSSTAKQASSSRPGPGANHPGAVHGQPGELDPRDPSKVTPDRSAGPTTSPASTGGLSSTAPPPHPLLQESWRKLGEVDARERTLARRRWDALTIIEQAELVRRGWTQTQPAPDAASRESPALSEAQARRLLDDAQRQLGERWAAHLATRTLDLLTRAEREALESERRALIGRIAALGEPVVRPLIDEIRAEGGRHKLPAAQALKQIGRLAVPALVEAVTSTERQLRWVLLDILAQAADLRARETFVRLLDDPDPHTRLGAFEGLRGLQPVPEDVCLRCVVDEYDGLRRAAIDSLAEIGGEQAIPALLEVARHDLHQGKGGGFYMRRIAVDALKQIGRRTGRAIDLPAEEIRKPAPRLGFEMLSQAARCSNAGIRHDAICRLGWSDEKRALDLLLDLLQSDRVPANRAAAVSALRELLAKTRDAAKPPPCTQAERERVFNIILDLARDENPAISSCALGNISMIAGESLPKYPRFPELFALALDAVQGVDRARQSSALTVLRFVGSSHAEALQQQLTPERRARLLTRLKAGMEDRERGYRIRCLEMLGYLRERSVVPRLVELLNHEDATVRSFAILALGHVGDPAALPALEKVAATDPATNHRRELYLRQSAQQAVHQIRPATEPAEP